MSKIIPPLQLDALLKVLPPEYHHAVQQLYHDTYTYAFNAGKQEQSFICQCQEDD